MAALRTVLLRVLIVPFCGLVFSHAALAIAHANGWFPELQLAHLIMASPSILQIEWARWALIALVTLMLWSAADYFLYRRDLFRKASEARASKSQASSEYDAHGGVLQKQSSEKPDRVPLATLREWAVLAGWCSDVQAATVGDNDWWTFSNRLRQAGVDGDIQFWGRRNIHGWVDKDTDSTPLIRIPIEHFEEFEFDCTQLAQCDNYEIFTTQLGEAPSAFRGTNYRDIYVKADDARNWLNGAGRPPPSADFHVGLDTSASPIGDYTPIVAIRITGLVDVDGCLASIEQMSRDIASLSTPLALRTDGQIRGNRNGRWNISKGQFKLVPILFRGPVRQNEWFLIHETGKEYFVPAGPLRLLIGIYGGRMDGKVLLEIEVGADWRVYPSIRTVDTKYQIDA